MMCDYNAGPTGLLFPASAPSASARYKSAVSLINQPSALMSYVCVLCMFNKCDQELQQNTLDCVLQGRGRIGLPQARERPGGHGGRLHLTFDSSRLLEKVGHCCIAKQIYFTLPHKNNFESISLQQISANYSIQQLPWILSVVLAGRWAAKLILETKVSPNNAQ